MFLPYRSKNPPESFPYVTVGLIVINTIVFALTSEAFLVIRPEMLERFAVSHNTLSPLRILTAMFLHGDIMHLAGNMLFLWIFGAAVEGRLRGPKFIVLYLLCGLAGDVFHELIFGLKSPDTPS